MKHNSISHQSKSSPIGHGFEAVKQGIESIHATGVKSILPRAIDKYLLIGDAVKRYSEAPEQNGRLENAFCSTVGAGVNAVVSVAGNAVLRTGSIVAVAAASETGGLSLFAIPAALYASQELGRVSTWVGDFAQNACVSSLHLFENSITTATKPQTQIPKVQVVPNNTVTQKHTTPAPIIRKPMLSDSTYSFQKDWERRCREDQDRKYREQLEREQREREERARREAAQRAEQQRQWEEQRRRDSERSMQNLMDLKRRETERQSQGLSTYSGGRFFNSAPSNCITIHNLNSNGSRGSFVGVQCFYTF